MANIQHANIPDANLHEAKGAASAPENTWLKADGLGATSFQPLPPKKLSAVDSISGSSLANQYISSVGSEIQVDFGGAQVSPNGSMSLAADGTLTFNQNGVYEINSSAIAGRTTNTGSADLCFNIRLNGAQIGRTFALSLDNADDTFVAPLSSTVTIEAQAGDVLTHHVGRYAGTDSGDAGVKYIPIAGLTNWSDAASTYLRIAKIEVVDA